MFPALFLSLKDCILPLKFPLFLQNSYPYIRFLYLTY